MDKFLPTHLEDAVTYLFQINSREDSWLFIKNQLLRLLPPAQRSEFSRIDPHTRKGQINELEWRIISRWEHLTGRPVVFSSVVNVGKRPDE